MQERKLVDWVRAWAEVEPTRPAVVDGHRTVSYRELVDTAEDWAGRIRAAGVDDGGVVALRFPRGAGSVTATLATLMVGATYIPLDAADPPARQDLVLRQAMPDAVVEGTDDVVGMSITLPPVGADARCSTGVEGAAYIMFTS